MKIVTGNNKFQKESNKILVLNVIRHNRKISRKGISEALKITPSTVTGIINELLDLNLILESSVELQAGSSGGRKQIYLEINKFYGLIAGVEFLVNKIKIVLVNILGDLIFSEIIDKKVKGLNFKTSIEWVYHYTLIKAKEYNLTLLAMSFSLSGVIDSNKKRIIRSIDFDIYDFDFKNEVANNYDIPMLIENDCRACGYGELWLKDPNTTSNFIYIYGREKKIAGIPFPVIGTSIVLENKVYTGAHYSSGEFSNNFRSKIVKMALLNSIKYLNNKELFIKDILKITIHSIVNILDFLDPEMVLLGDVLTDYAEISYDAIEKLNDKELLFNKSNVKKARLSSLGDYEASFGSACKYLEKWYSIPQIGKTGNS